MKYFTIHELHRTQHPNFKNSILNIPNREEVANLRVLVEHVLDPVRTEWGSPILVSSGYRCPLLNREVGGVEGSYHIRGMAADIYAQNGRTDCLFRLIERMYYNGRLLLTECYYDEKRGYIHIAYDKDDCSKCPFIYKTEQ